MERPILIVLNRSAVHRCQILPWPLFPSLRLQSQQSRGSGGRVIFEPRPDIRTLEGLVGRRLGPRSRVVTVGLPRRWLATRPSGLARRDRVVDGVDPKVPDAQCRVGHEHRLHLAIDRRCNPHGAGFGGRVEPALRLCLNSLHSTSAERVSGFLFFFTP